MGCITESVVHKRESDRKKGKDLSSLTNRLQRQIGGTVCSTGVTVTTATIRRERHLRNGSKQNTDKGNIKGQQQSEDSNMGQHSRVGSFLQQTSERYKLLNLSLLTGALK